MKQNYSKLAIGKFKKIFLLTFILTLINLTCYAVVIEEQTSLNSQSSQAITKSNSGNEFNQIALGFSLGFRNKIFSKSENELEELNLDYEELNQSSTGFINSLIYGSEIFVSKNIAKTNMYNLGLKLNMGMQIKKIYLLGSIGYLASNGKIKNQQNRLQKYNSYSPFYGVTAGYNLSKNYSINMNYLVYDVSYKNQQDSKKIFQKTDLFLLNFSYQY